MTVNRFCCSGSQTIALAADSVRAGSADIVIAGGVESMSYVPMGGNKLIAYPGLMDAMPNAYAGMGTTAEQVASRFEISRESQDEFAYNSHMKAVAALKSGKFKDEIVPLDVRVRKDGQWHEIVFDTDEGPRADTTVEGLSRLRPVFDPKGTVTAGNASQINDGAAAVVVMAEDVARETRAQAHRLCTPMGRRRRPARHHGYRTCRCRAEAPRQGGLDASTISTWSKSTRRSRASRSTASTSSVSTRRRRTSTAAPSPPAIPLGATGAVLTVKILGELKRRNAKRGMVTMCIGGGMGFAYLLEMAG